ncbi:MAG: tetratricopeptide repeat protein [Pseudolabrys sp.]|nr:tetratricopeptide repeat protein [Pseudolabrys sp.]MDP2298345.1 tetratricopeptide repeat protein [Pseudolabrys sp.]
MNTVVLASPHRRLARKARFLAAAALVTLLALPVAGCKTTSDDITGSIGGGSAATLRTDAEWRQSLDVWGARYRAKPDDAEAAMTYARGLRATDQRAQAVAVLEQASIRNPNNMAVLGAYGRALAEAGDLNQALDVLSRAHTPDNPDWRVLNAQGAVLDQLGRHAEAQRYYSSALKIIPDEPSVLSNLGLSYVLTKDLKRAEVTLRRALAQPNADPKVRQNLALVVGLRGRFDDAEKIAREGLAEGEAAANVGYLREMLAQQKDWKKSGGRPFVPPPHPRG